MRAWDDKNCFEHMTTYTTTPPLLSETFENSHRMRFWQANVLENLGNKYIVINWTEASKLFRRSGRKIMDLSKSALKQDNQEISSTLREVADIEERARKMLKDME